MFHKHIRIRSRNMTVIGAVAVAVTSTATLTGSDALKVNRPSLSLFRKFLPRAKRNKELEPAAGGDTAENSGDIDKKVFHPAAGVRVEKIANLDKNLAMALRADSVRILAPVPGKGCVGIEVPNDISAPVCLKEILQSKAWADANADCCVGLGWSSKDSGYQKGFQKYFKGSDTVIEPPMFEMKENISATDFRRALENGDSIQDFLPEGVNEKEIRQLLMEE